MLRVHKLLDIFLIVLLLATIVVLMLLLRHPLSPTPAQSPKEAKTPARTTSSLTVPQQLSPAPASFPKEVKIPAKSTIVVLRDPVRTPAVLSDTEDNRYLVVPCSFASKAMGQLLGWYSGMTPDYADLFQLSEEQRKAIAQVCIDGHDASNKCLEYCDISHENAPLSLTVKDPEAFYNAALDVSNEVLNKIRAIVGTDVSSVIDQMDFISTAYDPWCILSTTKGVYNPFKYSYVIKKVPTPGNAGEHLLEISGNFIGLRGSGGVMYRDIPASKLLKDLSLDYSPEFPRIKVNVTNRPFAVCDRTGQYCFLLPFQRYEKSSGYLAPFIKRHDTKDVNSPYCLTDVWQGILRLNDEQQKALVDAILKAFGQIDNILYQYSTVVTKTDTTLRIRIEGLAANDFKAAFAESIKSVSSIVPPDAVDAVSLLLHCAPWWKDDIDDTSSIASEILRLQNPNLPIVLAIEKTGTGKLKTKIESEYARFRERSPLDIPAFVWKFAPPSFADVAPANTIIGNETAGPKSAGTIKR